MRAIFRLVVGLLLAVPGLSLAQSNAVSLQFNWKQRDVRIADEKVTLSVCEGCFLPEENRAMPMFVQEVPLPYYGRVQVSVLSAEWENMPDSSFTRSYYDSVSGEVFKTPADRETTFDPSTVKTEVLGVGQGDIRVQYSVHGIRGRYVAKISILPVSNKNNQWKRLVSAQLQVQTIPVAVPRSGFGQPTNSVLRDGAIYKIPISKAGMYRLSADYLRTKLGIDLATIDPRNIQLFGNRGGMLPLKVSTPREQDLTEYQLYVNGQDDGRFDAGDYLLFYAEGADQWIYNPREQAFNMEKNIYAEKNYVFLKVGGSQRGARVGTAAGISQDAAPYTSTTFDDFQRLEVDTINLFHSWSRTKLGSGQKWYGDLFRIKREFQYPSTFNFPNLDTDSPIKLKAEMVLRAVLSSRFSITIDGQTFNSSLARRVSELSGPNDTQIDYGDVARINLPIDISSSQPAITVNYPFPQNSNDGSEGWLDYIQINARRKLQVMEEPLVFRDTTGNRHPKTQYRITHTKNKLWVWEITTPQLAAEVKGENANGVFQFTATSGYLRTFVAFNPDQVTAEPETGVKINNQNLHAIAKTDMVILHHKDFTEQANLLAEHRRKHSNLSVSVVDVEQVYNEFASGRLDVSAIRDFAKMLYERDPNFRYLLLMGDGSFDSRNKRKLGKNYIPVYEVESLNPLFAFPTDDIYAILDDVSPDDPLQGLMSISVGRLPVRTKEEAQATVNKIIHYETQAPTLGDWRTRISFVGDDEDGNFHTGDANSIADRIGRNNPNFNIDKIFLDAYPQVLTPGGDRYPTVNEAINQTLFRGALTLTYLGHGGHEGLAQERIISVPDITAWQNFDRLPLFITATCEFTSYDEPSFTSAGEEAILNPRGGMIGLFTTVRAVYASQNAELTERAMDALFTIDRGNIPTLGEALQRSKNSFSGGSIVTNSRKFALIGDPALHLAVPQRSMAVTAINGRTPNLDTLRAFDEITISGEVQDLQGNIDKTFNGVVYPTIFDKPLQTRTLGQDRSSPVFTYNIQKNVLFKGRATVKDGRFSFQFVVPKDINLSLGGGKISIYASDPNTMRDAAGQESRFLIGGINTTAITNDQPPQVEVFMNDEEFIYGGVTSSSPVLLVKVKDDYGVNVVGNSIGHDMEAVLDENTQATILLNDFYESALDDSRQGVARYPLSNIAPGRHTVRAKAWDIGNNPGDGYTEFIVAESGEIALEQVLNYPNPFTTNTCFQFSHNAGPQELDVLVQVFTVSGRLVKTIQHYAAFNDGNLRSGDCIAWDGRDDYGEKLAKGVYLYKIKLNSRLPGGNSLTGESEFQKLVILK